MKTTSLACRYMLLGFVLIITSCAYKRPAVPNISIIDPAYTSINSQQIELLKKAQKLLNDLSTINPTLANEFGKLPDFHDGIQSYEMRALEKLIRLYNTQSKKFNKTFGEMNTTGKPEVRKYCTPLQALFWLAQEDFEEVKRQLEDYGTEYLLNSAWNSEKKFLLVLSQKEVKELIDSINDEDTKKDYSHLKSMKSIREIILLHYDMNPNMFSKETREIIRSLIRENLRWKDPQKIIDRLNSPELFEHWFARNFTYDWSKFHVGKPNAYPQSAERSIKTKKGICFDAAYLACVCLKRAGYDATGLNVYWSGRAPDTGCIMHSVCIIKMKELDETVYYKVGDTRTRGSISGPYRSAKEVAERTAQSHGTRLGTYTTGVPAYHVHLWPGR